MFTGIIECTGQIKSVIPQGNNVRFTIEAPIAHDLKIDQSVSHDGVCLTVVDVKNELYEVVAIAETLKKSVLSHWHPGYVVNLERCLRVGDRLDGHYVQGHVDCVLACTGKEEINGSHIFQFGYDKKAAPFIVGRGSICINGISLTIAQLTDQFFSVAIIPYTYQHTNIHRLKVGDYANIELDILGKYILRHLDLKDQH